MYTYIMFPEQFKIYKKKGKNKAYFYFVLYAYKS